MGTLWIWDLTQFLVDKSCIIRPELVDLLFFSFLFGMVIPNLLHILQEAQARCQPFSPGAGFSFNFPLFCSEYNQAKRCVVGWRF
jgi:hypothetical protein